jgi:hypothetical protein
MMNTNTKCIFAFAVGVAVGSAVSWKLLKTKYEQIAQEEIDSVKAAFSEREHAESDERLPEESESVNDTVDEVEKPDMASYESLLSDSGYTDYAAIRSGEKKEEKPKVERPYVISPEEFGDFYDYERITLTHYGDHVLADEDDELVDDVDNTVGSDYADHFGDYENDEDSVYVRNDRLKCDYEILRDHRKYSDVTGIGPHQAED